MIARYFFNATTTNDGQGNITINSSGIILNNFHFDSIVNNKIDNLINTVIKSIKYKIEKYSLYLDTQTLKCPDGERCFNFMIPSDNSIFLEFIQLIKHHKHFNYDDTDNNIEFSVWEIFQKGIGSIITSNINNYIENDKLKYRVICYDCRYKSQKEKNQKITLNIDNNTLIDPENNNFLGKQMNDNDIFFFTGFNSKQVRDFEIINGGSNLTFKFFEKNTHEIYKSFIYNPTIEFNSSTRNFQLSIPQSATIFGQPECPIFYKNNGIYYNINNKEYENYESYPFDKVGNLITIYTQQNNEQKSMYFFQPNGELAERVYKINDINDYNYMIYEDKFNLINSKPKQILYFFKNKDGDLISYFMDKNYRVPFKKFKNNKLDLIPTDNENKNINAFEITYELNNQNGNEIYLNIFRQEMIRNIDLSMTVWNYDNNNQTFKIFNDYLNFPITTDFDNFNDFSLNIKDLENKEVIKFIKWNGFLNKTELAYNRRSWPIIFYMITKNNTSIINGDKWLDTLLDDWNTITDSQPETNSITILRENINIIRKYLNYGKSEVGPNDIVTKINNINQSSYNQSRRFINNNINQQINRNISNNIIKRTRAPENIESLLSKHTQNRTF